VRSRMLRKASTTIHYSIAVASLEFARTVSGQDGRPRTWPDDLERTAQLSVREGRSRAAAALSVVAPSSASDALGHVWLIDAGALMTVLLAGSLSARCRTETDDVSNCHGEKTLAADVFDQ